MNIPVNQFPSIEQMRRQLGTDKGISGNQPYKSSSGISFHEILEKQVVQKNRDLKFSKHANERLASRNIDLTEDQLRRLETGAKKASEKGIKESLVMVDNLAFIVNIKNKTVITAVNDGEEKVFTNIDGAVVI
ncbi:MAG: flagellar protein [Clostridiales bacterium]|jgi:flagellar operon protein|nr:flagellar protein [Clostridiales bacterium]